MDVAESADVDHALMSESPVRETAIMVISEPNDMAAKLGVNANHVNQSDVQNVVTSALSKNTERDAGFYVNVDHVHMFANLARGNVTMDLSDALSMDARLPVNAKNVSQLNVQNVATGDTSENTDTNVLSSVDANHAAQLNVHVAANMARS